MSDRDLHERETVSADALDETRTLGRERRAPARPRRKIAGYTIIRELGSGGMGTVYAVHDEKLQRTVALKALSRGLAPSADAAKRFAKEAWIAGRLNHPNLVQVHDRGEWEDVSFYTMELVDGGSLHDVIEKLKDHGTDEDRNVVFGSREYIPWVLGHMITAARALHFAHQQGVVHRDVKPMNILLSREPETVKIADFGLAMSADGTRITAQGQVMGSLRYMAPEQLRGKLDQIGVATDVYALGVTLFELLTLEFPYEGDSQEVYSRAVLESAARRTRRLNDRVSRDLDVVIQKALEKNPADRYASAAALADDLENVLQFRPIRARPPSWPSRASKWVRRKPIHAALIAGLVLGIPAVSILGVRAVQHQRLVRQQTIEGLWEKVRWATQRSRRAEAAPYLDQILDLDPDHVLALRSRALLEMHRAEQEEDGAARTAAGQRAIDTITRVAELRPGEAWPHMTKAYILRRLGDEAGAAVESGIAERLRDGSPGPDELHIEGWLAMNDGEYRRATDLFTKLLVHEANNPEVYARRAAAFVELGEFQKAHADYRFARSLDPTSYYSSIDLGKFYSDYGDPLEGEGLLRRAIELAPDSAHAHEALSDNLLQIGRAAAAEGRSEDALARFREAETVARRALELHPDLIWAPVNLGASLIEQNRLRDASDPALVAEAVEANAAVARRFEDAAPGSEEYAALVDSLVNTCDALLEAGDPDGALDSCRRVVALRPDSDLAHYNMAGVHAIRGDVDAAFAELERDFELGDRDWQWLFRDGWFESLRDDPRFVSLIERMKADPGE